jgi:iron-sulfur cluster assembly accessory protein
MSLIQISIKQNKKNILSQNSNLVKPIELTLEAANRINFLCKYYKINNGILKVIIQNTGCSGKKFFFKLVRKPSLNYIVFSKYNASFCISSKYVADLNRAKLILTKNNDFIIESPNIIEYCSCGKSFSF